MSAAASRKAFEAWYASPRPLERILDGSYRYMPAHTAWTAWQESRKQSLEKERKYGRISAGLINAAEHAPEWIQDGLDGFGKAAVCEYENQNELGYAWARLRNASHLHRSLFLLILAEAMADEWM